MAVRAQSSPARELRRVSPGDRATRHESGTKGGQGPPASCTNMWINAAGLLWGLVAFYTLRESTLSKHHFAAIILAATAVPILTLEALFLRTYSRESTGLEWKGHGNGNWGRVGLKWMGLLLTLSVFAFGYWLFPEYHGSFYDPFWSLLKFYGPWALALSVPYFYLVDARSRDPHDAYWHLGHWLISRRAKMDWPLVGRHFLGWLVKGFFLPLMFVYLTQGIGDMQRFMAAPKSGFVAWFDLLYQLTFFIDLMFTVSGYILTLRLTDTHLRWAEPTTLGWLAALVCYQPFHSIISAQYLHYHGTLTWGPWLAGHPAVEAAWGCAILVCVGIYAWSTVCFGCRFSNLTHRGILTNGTYRFTKHPAYLSKNLSWWLISIPFIANNPGTAIRQSCLLLLLNAVYYLRAITEERHLSRDPVYVEYALWMNEHGMFRWLSRVVPALRYKPPPNQ